MSFELELVFGVRVAFRVLGSRLSWSLEFELEFELELE